MCVQNYISIFNQHLFVVYLLYIKQNRNFIHFSIFACQEGTWFTIFLNLFIHPSISFAYFSFVYPSYFLSFYLSYII